jgi:hypothetical protein
VRGMPDRTKLAAPPSVDTRENTSDKVREVPWMEPNVSLSCDFDV